MMAEDTMIADAPLGELVLDRRRPGRTAHVSEHLIDLLRASPDFAATDEDFESTDRAEHLEHGPPRYAHGVLVQLVLSAVLWSVIAITIWLIF